MSEQKTTWRWSFWGKRNTKWFAQCKENINRKWRPPLLYKDVNAQLEKEWFKPAWPAEIEKYLLIMSQLNEDKLKDIEKDKKYPYSMRVFARSILSHRGLDALEKTLNRAIWTPTQKIETKWIVDVTVWLSDKNKEIEIDNLLTKL